MSPFRRYRLNPDSDTVVGWYAAWVALCLALFLASIIVLGDTMWPLLPLFGLPGLPAAIYWGWVGLNSIHWSRPHTRRIHVPPLFVRKDS